MQNVIFMTVPQRTQYAKVGIVYNNDDDNFPELNRYINISFIDDAENFGIILLYNNGKEDLIEAVNNRIEKERDLEVHTSVSIEGSEVYISVALNNIKREYEIYVAQK